jgi:hypothetical protein
VTRRPAGLALAGLLAAAMLSGCSIIDRVRGGPVPESLDAARASMESAYDAVEQVIAPVQMTAKEAASGYAEVSCDSPTGREGLSLLAPVLTAIVGDPPERLAARIREAWLAKGYEVNGGSGEGGRLGEVSADLPDGGHVAVTFAPQGIGSVMSIGGETGCVPS